MLKKVLLWTLAGATVLVVAGYLAIQISPWPAALFFRAAMDRGGVAIARALEKHVPAGVTAQLNERYDTGDADAFLDVFHPAEAENTDHKLPTVVWVHGGGFISGDKDQVANYLKILAAKGFTTVGVNYSLAPGTTYPAPIKQVMVALAYLEAHATQFHIDPSKFFLAGDSAGAQIAAQLANLISTPTHAQEVGVAPSIDRRQLRGVLLHCGVYDPGQFKFEGLSGFFLKTVIWSYFGAKDPSANPRRTQFSVIRSVSAALPPMFISVGNGDSLAPQSRALAETVARHGVPVDVLFFPDDHSPPLPHEYQFNLDTEAGQTALARSVGFLAGNSR